LRREKGGERASRKKYKQEVDTNVYQISLSCLKEESELATGDPVVCSFCQAIFNRWSKIEETKAEEGEDPQQVWTCEFCNQKNNVNLEEEEKPKTDKVNYIVEAAAQIHDKKNPGMKQDVSVVFCIDISGSMCVSNPVSGKHNIKGDKMKDQKQDLMKFSDGSDQRLQGESNVTYISRMQCVQAAIDAQLAEMAQAAPDRKIGLVTFNHEVQIVGDGTQKPQIIAGDKLCNNEFLLQNGVDAGK